MNLVWFAFSMVFIRLARTEEIHSRDDVTKQRAEPPKPQFPNTFQVEVEGIFKDKSTGADGTLYFDRENNRATWDMLWEADLVRQIYSFESDELIIIKGYACTVQSIPNNPALSFFPFAVDPESKQKKISSAEEALFFHKSKYVQDTLDDIEAYMYQGFYDIPKYMKTNCSIIHRFSKTEFESASCEQDPCQPILLSMSVNCAAEEEGTKDMDHLYRFFHFTNTIQDDSVFHTPPGVFCDKKQIKNFPTLPMFFSFTYDVVKKETYIENVGGLRILHKKVWYDGDLELIRVDGFDNDGLLSDTHIYDFYNEMTYVMFPQRNDTDRDGFKEDMTLHKITLLPKEIFPRTFKENVKNPIYTGTRKVNGLDYHVWSFMTTETEDFKEVTELYFLPAVSEVDGGDVTDAGFQISFLQVFTYSTDEDDSMQLSEITFTPINNFQSTSRTFSMFDVSSCFENEEKKEFEISVTGEKLLSTTKLYQDFLEQLYLGTATAASVSIVRISKFETVPDVAENITNFRGGLLEKPDKLGYGKMNNESDLKTAFAELEQFIRGGLLGFTISDKYGQEKSYSVISIREVPLENKDENKNCTGGIGAANVKTYTRGEFAAVAIMMLIVGLSIGALGLVFLIKKNLCKIRVHNK